MNELTRLKSALHAKLADQEAQFEAYESVFRSIEQAIGETMPSIESFVQSMLTGLHGLESEWMILKAEANTSSDASDPVHAEIQTRLQEQAQKIQMLLQSNAELERNLQLARSETERHQERAEQLKSQSDQFKQQTEELKQRLESMPTEASNPEPTARPRSRAPRKTVAPNANSKRILIVDRTEINRVLMGHFFKGLPIHLDYSIGGDDAIQKCERTRFDAIVMNPQNADISRIQAHASGAQLIAMSSQEPAQDEIEAVKAVGFTTYLSRPRVRELFAANGN